MRKSNQLISVPLIAAACVAEGAFSLVGMLLCCHSFHLKSLPANILAGCSAYSAVDIEGEIFFRNIPAGVNRLLSFNSLRHRLLCRWIDEKLRKKDQDQRYIYIEEIDDQLYIKDDPDNKNIFLYEYAKYHNTYKNLTNHHFDNGLTKEQRRNQLEETKKHLYSMEIALLHYFNNNTSNLNKEGVPQISEAINDAFAWDGRDHGKPAPFLSMYKTKRIHLRLCNLINTLGFAGSFFSALFMVKAFFAFLAVAITASTGGMAALIIIAVLAAAANAVMMYNVYHKIIANNEHIETWNNIKETFRRLKTSKNYAKVIAYTLATIIFIALFSVVTLGTFGTWLHAGIGGYAVLFQLSTIPGNLLIGTLSVCYTLVTSLFTLKNIADTLCIIQNTKIIEGIKDFINGCINLIKNPYEAMLVSEDSFFQKHNHNRFTYLLIPIIIIPMIALMAATRMIFKVLAGVTFIWHCLSEGATTDNAFFIPPALASAAGGTIEVLNDLPYVVHGEEKKHPNEFVKNKIPMINIAVADGHTHGNITLKLTVIALTLSLVLPMTCVFYKLLSGKTWQESWHMNAGQYWQGHHADDKENNKKTAKDLESFSCQKKRRHLQQHHTIFPPIKRSASTGDLSSKIHFLGLGF